MRATIDTSIGTVLRDDNGRVGIVRRNRDQYLHLWLTPEEQDALWEVLKDDDRRATSRRSQG